MARHHLFGGLLLTLLAVNLEWLFLDFPKHASEGLGVEPLEAALEVIRDRLGRFEFSLYCQKRFRISRLGGVGSSEADHS